MDIELRARSVNFAAANPLSALCQALPIRGMSYGHNEMHGLEATVNPENQSHAPLKSTPNPPDHTPMNYLTRLGAKAPRDHPTSVQGHFLDTRYNSALTEIYIEPQEAAFCALHSLNTGLQRHMLNPTNVNPHITRNMLDPALSSGWYHMDDINCALKALSNNRLEIRGAHPHTGLSNNTTWSETLSLQTARTRTAPFLLLVHTKACIHPFRSNHMTCALHLTPPAEDWYLLDSCEPHYAGPLSTNRIAQAFDAEIYYIDNTNSTSTNQNAAPTRDHIIACLTHPQPSTPLRPQPRPHTPTPPQPRKPARKPPPGSAHTSSCATHNQPPPDFQNLFTERHLPPTSLFRGANNGLQQSLFTCDNTRTHELNRNNPNAHTDHIAAVIHTTSGGHLTLRKGKPHLGHTNQRSWAHTLTTQTFLPRTAPFVILVHRDNGLPPFTYHQVSCAIRRQSPCTRPTWHIIDAQLTGTPISLANNSSAQRFDADVYYLDFTDSIPFEFNPTTATTQHTLPNRQQLNKYLSTLRSHTRTMTTNTHDTPPPWPGSSPVPDPNPPNPSLLSLDLLLFIPKQLLRNRTAFLHICTSERLHLLSHAQYNIQNDHLKLTITNQSHLNALSNTPFAEIANLVRKATKNWRLVVWNPGPTPAPLHTQNSAHQIHTMTTPPNTTTPTALSNRFTPLTNELPTEPSIDTCDPTPYTPTISTTPSAGRFGTTRRKTHKHRNTLTLATLNIKGLDK